MKRMMVIVFGVAIALCIAIYLNRGTIDIFAEQKQIQKDSNERMKNAEAERARLLMEKAKIESPSGKEELARKMGYKQNGEIPLKGN